MSVPVLIWGAGAVGGSIGAALVRSGHNVTFVDLDRAHVAALRDPDHGLVVQDESGTFRSPVRALTPDEVKGVWGQILLCVKAQHTLAAARAAKPHLTSDGWIVSLQNGLTEPLVAEVVGDQRTLGGFVNFGADVIAPGVIRFGAHGAVRVGELDGAMTNRVHEAADLLRAFDPDAGVTSDIASYIWGKLGYAVLLYAQATGRSGIVACLDRADLLPLWQALAGEIMRVAKAEGVMPQAFNGFDPAAFLPGANANAARTSVAAMADFNRGSSKTHSGVWRDLAVHKRRTEVEAHYGPVLAAAARHGITCSTLDRLVTTIHAIEDGAAQEDANLDRLLEAVHV